MQTALIWKSALEYLGNGRIIWLLHVLDLFSHISRLVGRTFVRGSIVCNARRNALSRASAWHRISLEKAAATKLRNVGTTSLVFYYPDYNVAPMCDDGLTHRPIIDGNQKKRCPTRISGKRLASCLHALTFFLLLFLFLLENFYSCTRINQPGGKLLQWLVNSENSHDTPRWCTMARYSENTTLTWNILMTLDNSVSQPEARPSIWLSHARVI